MARTDTFKSQASDTIELQASDPAQSTKGLSSSSYKKNVSEKIFVSCYMRISITLQYKE